MQNLAFPEGFLRVINTPILSLESTFLERSFLLHLLDTKEISLCTPENKGLARRLNFEN